MTHTLSLADSLLISVSTHLSVCSLRPHSLNSWLIFSHSRLIYSHGHNQRHKGSFHPVFFFPPLSLPGACLEFSETTVKVDFTVGVTLHTYNIENVRSFFEKTLFAKCFWLTLFFCLNHTILSYFTKKILHKPSDCDWDHILLVLVI